MRFRNLSMVNLQAMIGGSQRLAVLVVIAASLAFAPSALASGTGQITGTVTNASTAEPVNGIEVCAYPEYPGTYGCAKTERGGDTPSRD